MYKLAILAYVYRIQRVPEYCLWRTELGDTRMRECIILYETCRNINFVYLSGLIFMKKSLFFTALIGLM
jgi:hypothetical protein